MDIAVTPKKLLDLGGGAVNELSYQQASGVGVGHTAEPAAMSTCTHTGATLLLHTPPLLSLGNAGAQQPCGGGADLRRGAW